MTHTIKEGFFQKPINSLIFFEELSAIIRATSTLIFSENFLTAHAMVSTEVCSANMVLSLLALAINITLGWSIAFMRLLYVEYPIFTLIHEKRIAAWLLSMVAAMGGFLTFLWYSSDKPSPSTRNTVCLGLGYDFAKVRLDYIGVISGWGPRIGVIIVALQILCEFIFYLTIFIHLIRNNKAMAAYLPSENIKKRNRGNVTQLTGHCLKFGLKFVWLAIGGPTAFISKKYLLELQMISWQVMYGIINILQMVVSPVLRHHFGFNFKKIFKCMSKGLVSQYVSLARNRTPDITKALLTELHPQ